ncbi:hypothetical protein [Amphritea japonica]|uniref:Uncharacterized protein n=1 Tax=Amphritea japonica ATCC BAA-1530 TaxID=1278309 RepID=A0A7R6STM3_9GAMM|nr:hypothetical protein [Amphritea japonica]BBB27436.1 hypothetical protein AMJAP_2850 [Amphritea japonica ATCC BAA-1530]
MYSDNRFLKPVGFSFAQRSAVLSSMLKHSTLGAVLLAILLVYPSAYATDYFENYSGFKQALTQALQSSGDVSKKPGAVSIMLKYNDSLVSYEYQHWQVKPESVCYSVKYCNEAKYSRCMDRADEFFHQTCEDLKQEGLAQPRAAEYQKLYCSAAEKLGS